MGSDQAEIIDWLDGREEQLLALLIKLKLNYDSLKLSFSIMIHPSSTNPILIHPLLPTSLPVSTPNNIHHSRLTVCLTDSLDLHRCLSSLFWLSACE